MKLRIGTIFTLSIIAFGANAADWQDILRQPVDGEMVSVDKASLVDLGNGMVEGWFRNTFQTPSRVTNPDGTSGPLFTLQLSRYVFDCKERRQKMMEVVLRNNKDKLIMADRVTQPRWESVPPDTIMYTSWVWGCHKHYPTS